MVTYALDSSAVLRFLDNEAGADRVSAVIKDGLSGLNRVIMSALHLGEVVGVTAKIHGSDAADLVISRLYSFGFEFIPVSAERAIEAALIKVKRKIPYADAFGVQLVSESLDYVLITADFDLKPAVQDVKIEFLPKK